MLNENTFGDSGPELLTPAQMRALEQAAIESAVVTGTGLMERAGAAVVAAVVRHWPNLSQGPRRAVILCGPGNNGGDGFVVARLLQARGWVVELFFAGDATRLSPDARANHDRWAVIGAVWPLSALPGLAGGTGLIVDALFGLGLRRALDRDLVQRVIVPLAQADHGGWRRVAVDIPSGICADSGRILTGNDGHAAACRADLTVTFHSLKPGHLLAEGPDHCGRVVVQDIGLPVSSLLKYANLRAATAPAAAVLDKGPGHKFSHGHAVVLSGGAGRSGAARLAARGALRIGAGLVTLAVPASAQAEVAAQITAVMMRGVEDGAALAQVLQDVRITALCLGPGLGLDSRAAGLVSVALADRARAVVLDADALSLLGGDPALFAALHSRCVLTPHAGEFARLFPDLALRLAAPAVSGPACSKVDITRAAAARAGCVVLFKGPDTVIAAPDGRCVIHSATGARRAPWLATAGAGDVLAGFIAGLLARGHDPLAAAEAATWLHVTAARAVGPGLIAEDLPEALPRVFRSLGL